MPRVGEAGVREAEEKMLAVGESPAAVAGFRRRYERLEAGDEGLLREAGIEPVAELPGLDELDVDPAIAQRALEQAVVVKVNGGPARAWACGEPRACSRSRRAARSST